MPRLKRGTNFTHRKRGRETRSSTVHPSSPNPDTVPANVFEENSRKSISIDHNYARPVEEHAELSDTSSVLALSTQDASASAPVSDGRAGRCTSPVQGRENTTVRQPQSPEQAAHQVQCSDPEVHSPNTLIETEIVTALEDVLIISESDTPLCDEAVLSGTTTTPVVDGSAGLENTTRAVGVLLCMDDTSSSSRVLLPPNIEDFTWKDPVIPCDGNLLFSEAHKFIQYNLPESWMCFPSEEGFHLMMMCQGIKAAVQRDVFVKCDGSVEISVHRQSLQPNILKDIISKAPPSVSFSDESWRKFSERAVFLARRVNSYDICVGADNASFKEFWQSCVNGTVDKNPYGELRYSETCRATTCSFLIENRKNRCHDCFNIKESFRGKRRSHQGSDYNPNTPNIHLDESQKLAKLKDQHDDIRAKQKVIDNQKKNINQSLDQNGVQLDNKMSAYLKEALETAEAEPGSVFGKFNSLQKLFLKEQIKVTNVKGRSGVKWHPAIIRLALLVRSLSKSAYNALRDSGAIKLPSDRTLYEYSHVLPAEEGCHLEKLNIISEKVKQMEHSYQSYHVLMFDEMHISKNLVYQKSTGDLIGYVNLSDVEKELHDLETFINSEHDEVTSSPPIATQMLTFMIKGVASSIKETVTTFTTSKLNQYELYSRFWDVMGQLERRGIKIIAAVCDGCSVNRAFIKMHVPFTKLLSRLVFDTLNLCTDDRVLYFISDVPHLLKTARNCFYNSGYGPHFKRLLTLNGEHIVWQTIRNIYNGEKGKTWRKCRKLNGQNVNLNTYSVMKVSYAAQVLSNTVATALKALEWDNTEETVIFIKRFNDFFDMLNGAYSTHHIGTKNANLAPYCAVDDERFVKLMEFLKYLQDWQNQVNELEDYTKAEKLKMVLSRETMEGLEITIRGFIGATKFLLSVGTQFVNPRVFCQDPLEQYHSKQRANVGGSSNPNVLQFLHTDNKVAILREVSDMSVRHRKGNVKAPDEHVQISDEPVRKRVKIVR